MELNPNHPTTMALHDSWHVIVAALMVKFGIDHVVITMDDLKKMNHGIGITVRELEDGIHLQLVSLEEGQALAKAAGGLPS